MKISSEKKYGSSGLPYSHTINPLKPHGYYTYRMF
jgi:hypothetical protein